MAVILRQSTAVDILIGPFVDEDDGKTLEESLTISQGDVMLSKNGQALAQKNDNTACAFDDFGCYNCELDATDTNTVGELTVIVFEDGALPFRRDYQVVEEAIYDALYAGSATGALPVSAGGIVAASFGAGAIDAAAIATDAIGAAEIADGAITAATFAAGAIDAAAIAANAIGASELADGAITAAKIATGAIDADALATDAVTEIAAGIASTVLVSTTIATLASQTSFTLTAGSADNDAYNGAIIIITDASTAVQKAVGVVSDYVGSTKTVTLLADPGVFTMAVSDLITIVADKSPTLAAINAEVLDVLNVDTFAEPTGVPPATTTLRNMLGFLYSFGFRNKVTVTASKKTYFDDGDAAEFEKDLSDDATTYTESESNSA